MSKHHETISTYLDANPVVLKVRRSNTSWIGEVITTKDSVRIHRVDAPTMSGLFAELAKQVQPMGVPS